MDALEFKILFEKLTGNAPLSWQERLFHQHFLVDKLPSLIDIPTGLGKTMVMAIWLIARGANKSLPRRLIYVVDRRTVVDQATAVAERLRKLVDGNPKLKNGLGLDDRKLPISTLRGQLADNREWSRDPSLPAIIIGTVDLIGSALLFSGYRSSYKRRPLEAGLLGQDSLLVLDEAHLSKPFEKLLRSITEFQHNQGSPMQVIRMSATSVQSNSEQSAFTLQFDREGKLAGEDARDAIIAERFCAKKRLTVITIGEKDDPDKKLTDAAINSAESADLNGKRIVVFVRSPEDARNIADRIRNHAKPSKSKSNPDPEGPFASSVEVLTGTMRGLERDELVDRLTSGNRWLNGELDPSEPRNQQPAFIVSTSAGEVGFDLNADHLIGDAAPLDSWIQRLGRVNRRGKGKATVLLVKENAPADKTDFDKACIAASSLLTDCMDVSPRAIAIFKNSLTPAQIDGASSPKPTMVDLTDILLDAWSMTSISEPMPGRPEVAPWLRGISDDMPQTTIAWRAELDLSGFAQLDLEDLEEWFDTHSVRTRETLSVPTNVAAEWFTDRWANLTDVQRSVVRDRAIVVDRAGLKLITVDALMEQLARKNTDHLRNADLIIPASFGGIERGVGLLDPATPKKRLAMADDGGAIVEEDAEARSTTPDVADEPGRYRQLIIKSESGISDVQPVGAGTKPANASRFVVQLESRDDMSAQLISFVQKRDKPEWGLERQTLCEHVGLVRQRLDGIIARFDIPEALKRAAELAADYHDHGKNRERWQRTVNGTATVGTTDWMQQTKLEGGGKHQCIGKSGGEMKRDPRGYRHELGSCREFNDAHRTVTFADSNGVDITQEVTHLALHLIASHHGRGRPHFPKGGFDPDAESRSPSVHNDVIRRFAHLQRKYGWWRLAWLENLLRCADALASFDSKADHGSESRDEVGGAN